MDKFPQSFEVYGFTIEVNAGGRRVWPPSFKRYIKEKLDSGELTDGQVMKICNASQSLVYKWRADVKASKIRDCTVPEEPIFSEVVFDAPRPPKPAPIGEVFLRSGEVEISLPIAYPVDDLIKVIQSLEARA